LTRNEWECKCSDSS
ncbi:matrix protein 2, partial [Influenza A virus (A/northern pintail/California/44221-639/2006(H11N9))]